MNTAAFDINIVDFEALHKRFLDARSSHSSFSLALVGYTSVDVFNILNEFGLGLIITYEDLLDFVNILVNLKILKKVQCFQYFVYDVFPFDPGATNVG